MSTASLSTSWNCPNYVGELFQIGGDKTPFLSMIGGLQNGGKTCKSFKFPVAQPWSLDSGAQPAITEDASVTGASPKTYVRGQDENTVQIFQRKVQISYAKQSATGQISGLSINGTQPVDDELSFQINAHLKQIAKDVEYTFINGTYVAATAADVAAKTRGIVEACTTNTVAASSSAFSKAILNSLLQEMYTNGAEFDNMVLFCNIFQKMAISSLYGYAPESRNVGGLNIEQIETDVAKIGIMLSSQIPAGTIAIVDVAHCSPMFLPVENKGVLFYEPLAKSGASDSGQIYSQIGLDHGPEEYHGTITGLATS